MDFKTLFIVLVIALLLSGCIVKPVPPTDGDKNVDKSKDDSGGKVQPTTVTAEPLIDLKNPPKSKGDEAPPSLPGK